MSCCHWRRRLWTNRTVVCGPFGIYANEMVTHPITLDLPLSVSNGEVKLLVALKLYKTGKMTLGQAARLADFSKRAFMEILGQHQIPVFSYSPEELEREIQL